MAASANEATSEMTAATAEATSDMAAATAATTATVAATAATTATVAAPAAPAASATRQGISREGGRAKHEGRAQDDCFMEADYSHGDSPLVEPVPETLRDLRTLRNLASQPSVAASLLPRLARDCDI
jgi:hypothetical protein